jgi:membrane-associated PAP2 superfamily phosphatase
MKTQITFMQPWLPKPTLGMLWKAWLLSAMLIVWLANGTSIDLYLADQHFDFALQAFSQKHDFFYETIMHEYAKHVLTLFWLTLLIISCLPDRWVGKWLTVSMRYKLRWILFLALLNALLVSGLKHQMPHACPWDVARYGGDLEWAPTFSSHTNVEEGHCFPAGHASSGVWLSALCLLWLPHAPRKALFVGLSGLAVGFMLGWAQQVRGAHFLSHTLTTLWLMCSWLLLVLTYTKSRTE